MRFKHYLEATDIFGFDKEKSYETGDDNMLSKPVNKFDIELMMELLERKSIGNQIPFSRFVNEIQWGSQPGAIRLEVDTGLTFYIKRLGVDKTGNPRWCTKRMFQLNRTGYGGLEDSVSQEIYEHLNKYYQGRLDAPTDDYKDLNSLVTHVYDKMKRVAKDIFIPEGIKKLNDDAYILTMGVRGHGLQAQDQRRVEQNQTMIAYDRDQGTIRIFNYNIESPVGKGHEWKLMENDLDIYFFPTQSRDEISECLAIHFKYY